MGGAKPFRHLNACFEHLFFGQTLSLLDEIIQTSVVDQFHDQIELVVIGPGRENLHDMRIVDRCGNARLLLQLQGLVDAPFQIFAQQLECNQAIQQRVTRLINGAHAANAQCLEQNKLIKRPLDAHLFTAFRTDYARQWVCIGPGHSVVLPANSFVATDAIVTFATEGAKKPHPIESIRPKLDHDCARRPERSSWTAARSFSRDRAHRIFAFASPTIDSP